MLSRVPKELKKFWKPSNRKSTIGLKQSDDTVLDETPIPPAIPSAEASRIGTPVHDLDNLSVSSRAEVLDLANAGVAGSDLSAARLVGKGKAVKKHGGGKLRNETLPAVEEPGRTASAVQEGSDVAVDGGRAVCVPIETDTAPEAMEATAPATESSAEALRPKKAKVAKKRKKPVADEDDIDAIFAGM